MTVKKTWNLDGSMTVEGDATAAKKKPGRKPAHVCTQEETIKRMSQILVGNGHPEDGLAFRFSEFMADHKRVVNDISEIKGKVIEAIESAGKAVNAVETYRSEMIGVEIGEGKRMAKKKLKFDTVVSIIGTIVIVIGLIITMLKSDKNANKIMTEQEYMDYKMMFKADKDLSKAPVRGNFVLYGDSINKDSLK